MAQDDEKKHDDEWISLYNPQTDQNTPVFGSKSSCISVAANKATFVSAWTGSNVSMVYGATPISIDDSPFTKIRWKIKIGYVGNYIMIGIASDNSVTDNIGTIANNLPATCKYYLRYGNNGTCHSDKQWKALAKGNWKGTNQNQTVTMEFDLENKTLSFWNDCGQPGNDIFEGIGFENIDFGGNIKHYYLAISLSYQNMVVSIEECLINDTFSNPRNNLIESNKLFDNAIIRSNKLIEKLKKMKNEEKIEFEDILKVSEIVQESIQYLGEIEEKKNKVIKILKEVDSIVCEYSKPRIEDFKNWGINEIIFWIMSLENGRFKKHCKTLKNGFEKNQIKGYDLPDISRQDLDVSFKVTVFRDRVLLEKHFQKLGNQAEGTNDTEDIE